MTQSILYALRSIIGGLDKSAEAGNVGEHTPVEDSDVNAGRSACGDIFCSLVDIS